MGDRAVHEAVQGYPAGVEREAYRDVTPDRVRRWSATRAPGRGDGRCVAGQVARGSGIRSSTLRSSTPPRRASPPPCQSLADSSRDNDASAVVVDSWPGRETGP